METDTGGPKRTIDESARGIYFIAGTWAVVGLVVGYVVLVQSAVMAVLGLWMQRSRSRVPVVILLIVGILACASSLLSWWGVTGGSGGNVLVPVLVIWLAGRVLLAITRDGVA